MNKISGVYSILHKDSGMVYIGSSVNISRRWKEHINHLNLNKHENPKLQNAWNKYGEKAFEFIILEKTEPIKEKILSVEQTYLDKFKSYERDLGFNFYRTAGSPQGNIWTEEQKVKLSEIRKKQFETQVGPMTGKKHSSETKEAMRKTHQELYDKLLKEGKLPPQTGSFKWSEEDKKKMSEERKGRPLPKDFGDKVRNRRLGTKRVNGHWVRPGDTNYPI